jgi:DNA gyrase subunit A
MERIKGPDFPTGALVVGRKGIEEAYRTGRGSITMRAVVAVEEIQNRQCLVVTELPYQTNPDNLAQKIADLVKDGKVGGIADVRDETSSRTGQRLVIVLKRDAVAKVVLNNLYKHTDLQTNFGANMLALVDGVPRTLSLDAFIRHWVTHQIEVIVRRTRFRLRKAEERAHILRGLLKALDAIDEVIALIRRSQTVDVAREGLMGLLEIDEIVRRSSRSTTSFRRRSTSTTRSSPRRSVSGRSSARNWPRSSTSSVTTAVPSWCPSTVTCPSRT